MLDPKEGLQVGSRHCFRRLNDYHISPNFVSKGRLDGELSF